MYVKLLELFARKPETALVLSRGRLFTSFREGWFVTGDVARRDRDGYVTIAGRKSVNFIKSGGFKISAREIEDVLRRHPRVKDVAVVGTPDPVWGQRIVAAVVLHPAAGPAPSSESLLARSSPPSAPDPSPTTSAPAKSASSKTSPATLSARSRNTVSCRRFASRDDGGV